VKDSDKQGPCCLIPISASPSPFVPICGGGLEKAQVDKGRVATAKFIKLVVREYMERIAAAGLAGHGKRSKIPAMIDRISAAA